MGRRPRILCHGLSDVGACRNDNEDSYLIDEEIQLIVVADGVGGHLGGEVASRRAVEVIREGVRSGMKGVAKGDFAIEKHPAVLVLPTAIKKAGAAVFRLAQENAELAGMGTTATGLTFLDGHAFFGHVGDSRAYLLRNNTIEQISEDHSLVNEQVKAGMITPEEAKTSRFRNVITRALGLEEYVAVDAMVLKAEVRDTYVLCSDGLSNLVEAEEIRDAVATNFLRDVPRALVNLANERGGSDNITVVVAYVDRLAEH